MVRNKTDKKDQDAINKNEFEIPVNESDLIEGSYFLEDADKYDDGDSKQQEALKKYKEYMDKKTIFQVKIKKADREGNLSVPLSGDLTGVIRNEELYGQAFDSKKRNIYVGQTYAVIVTEIDENKGIVYLSRHKAKIRAREILRATLKPGMQVKARVEFYQEKNKRVYVNIEGCGILGYIHISEWSHKFTEEADIIREVQPGDIIKVEILEYKPQKGKIKESYECSRRKCLKNPWEGIEEKVKRNDIIEIVATQLHKDKFYGPLPDMELDIYVEYPCKLNSEEEEQKECENSKEYAEAQRGKPRLIVRKGHKYQVRVYKVDEARQILRGRVIKEVTEER